MAKFQFKSRSASKGPAGCLGRVLGSAFFSVFLAFGVGFTGLIIYEVSNELNRWNWTATPCQIETSRLSDTDERDNPYRFEVVYRYRVQDREYAGTRWTFGTETFSDASEVQELVEQYAPQTEATCYVNPEDPTQAFLERGSLWIGLAILLPLIFVLVGGGGLWAIWFSKDKSGDRATEEKTRSLSSQARPGKISGGCIGAGILGIFLLVGCGLSWFFTLKPLLKISDAQNWVQTDCRILTSRLQEHRSDDGTTYRIDILYEYTHDGRTYKSNRYDFLSLSGSSSGREGKMEVIRRYKAGSENICWVNPAKPVESVLNRGLPHSWWIGILGPVSVLIGGGGLILMRRYTRRGEHGHNRSERGSRKDAAPPREPSRASTRGFPAVSGLPELPDQTTGVEWSPVGARFGRLLGIIFFAAFWNGIVGVFFFQMIASWQRGDPEYFFTIFLIPFEVIGIGFIGGVFYYFLGLFNPRPRLHLNTRVLEPGSVLDIRWEMRGSARRLRKLTFHLEGREEATYRRGTSTYTDKNVFADIVLFEADPSMGRTSGELSCRIPDGAMHSFQSSNNRIIWELRIHGEIPLWPDVNERLSLTLVPGAQNP